MKRRLASHVMEIEYEVSVSTLASIEGCRYKILDVLPGNMLRVKFIVNGPITHKLTIVSPCFESDYVFASYDNDELKLVKRNALEECSIENLEKFFSRSFS